MITPKLIGISYDGYAGIIFLGKFFKRIIRYDILGEPFILFKNRYFNLNVMMENIIMSNKVIK